MWQTIEEAISEATRTDFHISEKSEVTGGDINLAYRISNGQRDYFVKLNDRTAYGSMEQEAYSLSQIKNLAPISCPSPITTGVTLDKSFLVIEHLNLSDKGDWFELGSHLAKMHKQCTHGEYGWQHDNFIGRNLQPNKWQKNWSMFFSEQRIGWQLQLLHEKSITFGDIDHICQYVHEQLVSHHPRPSLLHGDLWLGNVAFSDQHGVIYDPACYYGDRECDIAMTELFGQFPSAFYRGYKEVFPLQKGYETRKHIYNFYHILNHANLFAGVYIDQARASLQRLFSLH
ncbi:fructosamine kinase family protein [Thalassotalea euphylliae]|uniref:fructosamine kinase family protein n=1 Tax=Thalassotalea euphylliae TaxID=1655234 RepID=UPI00363C2757